MDIQLLTGDITKVEVDAVVNAANSSLLGGGGVDGAIHRAGGPEILAECRHRRETDYVDGLPTGQAVATTAGDLPARWVIHTVGPVHGKGTRAQLLDCYANSLRVAAELGAKSIAFPLVSAGVYGWPKDDALRCAFEVLGAPPVQLDDATLVLFSGELADLAREVAHDVGVELAGE